jgi:hypothetical protein
MIASPSSRRSRRIMHPPQVLRRNPYGFRTVALVAAALALGASSVLVALLGSVASASAAKGSSGSFTFTGAVSGTLKVPAFLAPGSALTGCAISGITSTATTEGGTDTINWSNVKLDINGKSTKVVSVTLAINTASYGRTQSMVPSTTAPSTAVTFSTTYSYGWTSKTGSATTTKGGVSGSLKGTLSGTNGHAGSVGIRGSWAGCAKVNI